MGLIVVLPVLLTGWVVMFICSVLNTKLLEPIIKFIGLTLHTEMPTKIIIPLKIIILIGIIIFVAIIGWATKIIIVRKTIRVGEKIIERVPLIRKIYTTIRQSLRAILLQENRSFMKPVLVEYPRKGIYTVGFVTLESKSKKMRTVFVPTSPNPTSGINVIVKEEDIREINISAEEAIQWVVSLGKKDVIMNRRDEL